MNMSTRGLMRIVFAAALLAVGSAGNLRADTLASACTKTHAPQTLDDTQPINLGQLKLQLYFYACSGTYDSDLGKVLADAQAYVEQRAVHVSNPAIVLDIDETSLSNLPEELANDFGYIDGDNFACDRLPQGPCGLEPGSRWRVPRRSPARSACSMRRRRTMWRRSSSQAVTRTKKQ